MSHTCACVHVPYVFLGPCCISVFVAMLHTCACVHVAYVCVCSCCGCALVFMLRTCACVHVAYVRFCSCCVPKDSGLGPRVYHEIQIRAQGVTNGGGFSHHLHSCDEHRP